MQSSDDPVVLHVMNTAGAYPGPDTDLNDEDDGFTLAGYRSQTSRLARA